MPATLRAPLAERAPAKINLTLRIGRKRPDGYHDLESLVVFADIGDDLHLTPRDALTLSVDGEMAAQAGAVSDNLVLKAANALRSQIGGLRLGQFELSKILPVAAGIGGGSSDAAAALRLLARANNLPLADPRLMTAARKTGADVPVCLDPRPRIMRGIGDELSEPLELPALFAVMVNPRIAVPTAQVFAARADDSVMRETPAPDRDPATEFVSSLRKPAARDLVAALAQSANDLEAPAIALFPPVGDVLAALRALQGCRLARMSGSGGTCFGLFDDAAAAQSAARDLERLQPGWWVRATALGAAQTSQ